MLKLSGELQVAQIEIKRLRDRLLLSESPSKMPSVVMSPKNPKPEEEDGEPRSEAKQFKGRADFKLKLGAKPSLGVPKLDLKQLKVANEFKDWQAYAMKLENSVKFLRQRVD